MALFTRTLFMPVAVLVFSLERFAWRDSLDRFAWRDRLERQPGQICMEICKKKSLFLKQHNVSQLSRHLYSDFKGDDAGRA